MQKIWNLNFVIHSNKDKKVSKKLEDELDQEINNFAYKIDHAIEGFKFNVAIALFYEVYNSLKDKLNLDISSKVLTKNITIVMKLMLPFVPHLAHECLELHKSKEIKNGRLLDEKK